MAESETPVTQESLELVVMKAAKLVTDEILVREERRAKRNAIFFSVLALIGFGRRNRRDLVADSEPRSGRGHEGHRGRHE